MSPKAEQELIELLGKIRADLNINANRTAGELVNLTQELFLLRKTIELLLPSVAREELARFERIAPPSPDLEHQAQAQVTAAQQAEIDRALLEGELRVGQHGLPVLER